MDLNLKAPPVLRGNEGEQLRQLHGYLQQLQRSLTIALDGVSMKAAELVKESQQSSGTLPDGGEATVHEAYRQLKALIIKTAHTIRHEFDELVEEFDSNYVAISEFGTFKEGLNQTIVTTAQGVVQSFQYDSKLQNLTGGLADANQSIADLQGLIDDFNNSVDALESYNINTEQYIKTGLLYFDANNVPRYGVAVGEKLTTITVNGEEVIRRTNLVGTFTSDRLSFWQNDVEVAYVSNGQLYIQEARILSSLYLGNWVIDTSYGFAIKWAEG